MSWREWFGLAPRVGDLADHILSALRREGETGWRYEAENGALTRAEDGTVNLANLFLEYVQAPRADRAYLIGKYVALITSIARPVPTLWTIAESRIFAVLRSRHDAAIQQLALAAPEATVSEFMRWPWVDDLELRLVYDHGSSMAHLKREDADVWGRPDGDLRDTAIRNLAALSTPTWSMEADGVRSLDSPDSYTESLLLVDRVVDALPFAADVVCALPNRGVLLAVDGRDRTALLALFETAETAHRERPWPLTGTLVRRTAGTWSPFESDDAALRVAAARFRSIALASVYAEQHRLLERAFEQSDTDIFVATYALMQRPHDGNRVVSWCTWGEGVVSLLPQTDLVALVRDESSTLSPKNLFVEFADVQSVIGARMRRTEHDPPRWFVDSFPDEMQWRTLAARGEAIGE